MGVGWAGMSRGFIKKKQKKKTNKRERSKFSVVLLSINRAHLHDLALKLKFDLFVPTSQPVLHASDALSVFSELFFM